MLVFWQFADNVKANISKQREMYHRAQVTLPQHWGEALGLP